MCAVSKAVKAQKETKHKPRELSSAMQRAVTKFSSHNFLIHLCASTCNKLSKPFVWKRVQTAVKKKNRA